MEFAVGHADKENGEELEKPAKHLGETLRQKLFKASGMDELHTYVSYASGDETPKNWYGSEQWHQDKVLAFKNNYDPNRKFNFYAPIY